MEGRRLGGPLLLNMPSMNSVHLAGWCEGAPKLMGDRGNVVSFRLRVTEVFRKRGGEKGVKTDYFTIKAFGEPADYVGLNVADGTAVLVEGKLRTERWGEGEDRHSRTIVVADNVQAAGLEEADELMAMGVNQEPEAKKKSEESGQGGEANDGGHGEPGSSGPDGMPHEDAGPQEAQEAAVVPEAPGGGKAVAVDASSPEFEAAAGIQKLPW